MIRRKTIFVTEFSSEKKNANICSSYTPEDNYVLNEEVVRRFAIEGSLCHVRGWTSIEWDKTKI